MYNTTRELARKLGEADAEINRLYQELAQKKGGKTMKRWITLNQKISGGTRPLYVNAENISCFAPTHDEDAELDGSHLYLHGREGFFVRETPDEIMRMIRITLKPC